MENYNEITVLASGKAGDTIAGMAAVKEICTRDKCKAHIILDTTGGMQVGDEETKEIVKRQNGAKGILFSKSICEYLKPLLEYQNYISNVTIYDGVGDVPHIDVNLNRMRGVYLDMDAIRATGQNIELAHKYALKLPLTNTDSWLDAPKKPAPADICICRSTRYTSAHLWLALRENVLKTGFFLGTEFEHKVFNDAFGFAPKYIKTNNALEAASLIQSSHCFIGNGSLMLWIATGLGHPNIVSELCVDVPTTYYKNRPNITYIQGGTTYK